MSAIDETIDTAIELTDLVMARAPEYANDAIASLRNLHYFLANSIPQHPALRKLSRYIAAITEPDPGNTLQYRVHRAPIARSVRARRKS